MKKVVVSWEERVYRVYRIVEVEEGADDECSGPVLYEEEEPVDLVDSGEISCEDYDSSQYAWLKKKFEDAKDVCA